MLKDLENHFRIKINKNECQKFIEVFQGYDNYDNEVERNILVAILISCVSDKLNKELRNDRILQEGLSEHIKAISFKKKYGMAIGNNQLYEEILINHQFLYETIKECLKDYSYFPVDSLYDYEIGLIVVHFLGALRRLDDRKKETKKVVLVCQSGYSTSVLLKKFLESNYFIEVLDIISIYQIYTYNFKGLDFLISSISIDFNITKSLDIPVIFISPFLSFEESPDLSSYNIHRKENKPFIDINKMISIIEKHAEVDNHDSLLNNLKNEFAEFELFKPKIESLFSFLNKDDIYILDEKIKWVNAINICDKHLIKKGVIDSRYSQEIFHNIEKYGPNFIIKNEIAIPHARISSGVIKSGICILLSKERIEFPDNRNVRLIIMFASLEEYITLNTLMQIKKISNKEDFYKEVDNLNVNELWEYLQETIEK